MLDSLVSCCAAGQAGGAHFLAEKIPEGPPAPSGSAPQEHELPGAPSPPAEARVGVRVAYEVHGDGAIAMRWRIDARAALPVAPPAPLFQCAVPSPSTSCLQCAAARKGQLGLNFWLLASDIVAVQAQ
jgi:hypothetical protein